MSVHDITTYINKIKTERYAKDMREALYKALKNLSTDIKTFDAILSDASQETMGRVSEVLQEIYDVRDDLEQDIDSIQFSRRIASLLSEDGVIDEFNGSYESTESTHYGTDKKIPVFVNAGEQINVDVSVTSPVSYLSLGYLYEKTDGAIVGNTIEVNSGQPLSANTIYTVSLTPSVDTQSLELYFYVVGAPEPTSSNYGTSNIKVYWENYYPLSELISGDSEEDVSKLRNQISSTTNVLKEYPVGPTGRITQKASGTDVIEIDVSDVMDTDFLANLYLDLSSNNTPTENETLGTVTFYTNNGAHQQGPYIFTSDGFTYPSNTTKHSWMLSDLYKPNGSTNEKVVVEFYSTSNYYGGSGASYRVSLLKSYANKGAGLKTREFTMVHNSFNSDSVIEATYYQIGKLIHMSADFKIFSPMPNAQLDDQIQFRLETGNGVNGIIAPNHDISILVPTNSTAQGAHNNYIYHVRTGWASGMRMLLIEPFHLFVKDKWNDEVTPPVITDEFPQYINPTGMLIQGSMLPSNTVFHFDLTYTTDDTRI